MITGINLAKQDLHEALHSYTNKDYEGCLISLFNSLGPEQIDDFFEDHAGDEFSIDFHDFNAAVRAQYPQSDFMRDLIEYDDGDQVFDKPENRKIFTGHDEFFSDKPELRKEYLELKEVFAVLCSGRLVRLTMLGKRTYHKDHKEACEHFLKEFGREKLLTQPAGLEQE